MTCTDKETNLWAFHIFHIKEANKNWAHIWVKFLIDIQIFNELWQKVEQFAFHGLENLEYFEMKNNPMLESIHPKAFYDAIDDVGTPYPVWKV